MAAKITIDHDNPEWTAEDFARASGPEALSAIELAAFPKTIGRPKSAVVKKAISIRLAPDLIAQLKASGPGWQTRIEAVLRASLKV